MTPLAERLLAKSAKPPATIYEGWIAGFKIRLKLINRNAYNRCLMEWPDGMAREMTWAELNRKFKAVGADLA
jgi:hypothetical protein